MNPEEDKIDLTAEMGNEAAAQEVEAGEFTPDEAAASLSFATSLGEQMLGVNPLAEDGAEGQEAPVAQETAPTGPEAPEGDNVASQDELDAVKAEIEAIRAELELEDGPVEETVTETPDGQAEEGEATK